MKNETLKGKFTYSPAQKDYTVTMKKPFCWWWLLLLLLLVPLFLRCERELKVKVVDQDGQPVENVAVAMDYKAHYLYKGGFLTSNDIVADKVTDEKGRVLFAPLPCSVWGYMLHNGQKMNIHALPPAGSDYEPVDTVVKFYRTDEVVIRLRRTIELKVKVVDAVTHDPLAGAEVLVSENGDGHAPSVTDASGVATIRVSSENARLDLAGRKAGYLTNDTTLRGIRASDLDCSPLREIPLQKEVKCGETVATHTGDPLVEIRNMDMGRQSGTFALDLYTDSWPDRLEVLDDNGNTLLDTGFVAILPVPKRYTVHFTTRKVHFRVTSQDAAPNSVWNFTAHCPD